MRYLHNKLKIKMSSVNA